jgi:DNA-binding IclR family transcriptional regulator
MAARVQSIDRAVEILDCFMQNNELRLTEIVEMTGYHKSTVFGLVSTLKYHGLIDQDETSQKYRLGIAFLGYSDRVRNSLDIVDIASPIMRDICDKIQETVHLGLLRGKSVIYIEKIESNQSIRIASAVGMSNPAYCTGVGKVLLSGIPNAALSAHIPAVLEKRTPKTITSVSQLYDELDTIRKDGFGYDREEMEAGLYCVAFPIFDFYGKTAYAISVSGPSFRMEGKKEQAFDLLRKGSQLISAKLGYTAK